jgi:hypothetical protein
MREFTIAVTSVFTLTINVGVHYGSNGAYATPHCTTVSKTDYQKGLYSFKHAKVIFTVVGKNV